jgi:hypothetical protein
MAKNKNSPVRLNIYVHDPDLRRQIKTVAVKRDISVSEYCLQAITHQLREEQDTDLEQRTGSLKKAIGKARRFQKKAFAGRMFTVSSADLIAETRKDRSMS